jgi:hypothetical protein
MAVGNIKRGFNRLFLVLTVAWTVYCTVIYPFNERAKAFAHYQEDQRGCFERELGQDKDRLDACLKLAKDEWQTSVNQWSFKNFYIGAWPLILAAIVGIPLLTYGAVRGVAAVSLWVWRGYKTGPNVS